MTTVQFTLDIKQGETYNAVVTEYQDETETTPLSNVGYDALLQIRKYAGAIDVLVELTTAVDGGLTLGGVDGTTRIRIGADQTDNLVEGAAYDLLLWEITDPTNARYPIEGPVTLRRMVTEAP